MLSTLVKLYLFRTIIICHASSHKLAPTWHMTLPKKSRHDLGSVGVLNCWQVYLLNMICTHSLLGTVAQLFPHGVYAKCSSCHKSIQFVYATHSLNADIIITTWRAKCFHVFLSIACFMNPSPKTQLAASLTISIFSIFSKTFFSSLLFTFQYIFILFAAVWISNFFLERTICLHCPWGLGSFCNIFFFVINYVLFYIV